MIIGLLAAAFSVIRSTTIKTLVDAQERTIKTLQIETNEQLTIINTCKERLMDAEDAVRVLQDQVTGATAIATLAKQIAEQHEELLQEVKK